MPKTRRSKRSTKIRNDERSAVRNLIFLAKTERALDKLKENPSDPLGLQLLKTPVRELERQNKNADQQIQPLPTIENQLELGPKPISIRTYDYIPFLNR